MATLKQLTLPTLETAACIMLTKAHPTANWVARLSTGPEKKELATAFANALRNKTKGNQNLTLNSTDTEPPCLPTSDKLPSTQFMVKPMGDLVPKNLVMSPCLPCLQIQLLFVAGLVDADFGT
eukprot:CAMPEP_0175172912 /NCGR_PEP_ID=MMETSP0087-20121206/31728_1 /TAXON_ID=136419 /ORGANISM="Unknown Unknown, Strain D1" /LENGTH=122 /DNA_ID=CAMNT_0016464099 /DNA_START=429 /DNA_END=797 /DNA_ORIENTATION=-